MLGLVYHIGSQLGDFDLQQCHQAWSQNVAHHLLRIQALRKAWLAHWPRPLLFKGADLIENLYRDPGARPCADLDLLIPKSAFTHVSEALSSRYPRRKSPRYPALPGDISHQCSVLVDGALIEVHARPAPPAMNTNWTAGIYDRGWNSEVDGFRVRFPDPFDRLCLWLINQLKTGFIDGPLSLVDLSLILKSLQNDQKLDWHQLAVRLGERGLANAFDLAILRLDILGIHPEPLPDSHRFSVQLANRMWVSKDPPCKRPHPLQSESLKLWLCPPSGRIRWLGGSAYRLLRHGWRPEH